MNVRTAPSSTSSAGMLLPTLALWRREMVRFLRQRNRVVSAVVTPVLFWLLLGLGFTGSFTMPSERGRGEEQIAAHSTIAPLDRSAVPSSQVTYLEYFFPGTLAFMILSTAIFSTISVIEDRREGFLQGVLVAPAPRLAIVLGKVLGGATLATVEGVLLLAVWPLVGHWPGGMTGVLTLLAATGVMALLALQLTALGLCIAWPMNSTAGFHAVMMIFLMPLWFLSGAVFPITGKPLWLQVVMYANPLTYGQTALAGVLGGDRLDIGAPLSAGQATALTGLFTAATLALAVKLVSRPRKDGLA